MIDAALAASGWTVQDYRSINLSAARAPHEGIAVREFPGARGPADYLLYADAKAISIDRTVQRAGRLRQASLKRAFEGRLVAQEAADQRHSVRLGESRPVDNEGIKARRPARRRSVTA